MTNTRKSLEGMLSQMQFLKYFLGRNNWTRAIIKLLRVIQVISLYTTYCIVTLASADDIESLVLSKCDYLNQHISQSNAFWRNGKVGHICCMCPVGTMYTGICNSTDPTSTVCEPCDDGTFQDYQPHMQKECESQILKNCYDPYILEGGSITKASKCVCKRGTEEIGIVRKCTPISGRSPNITTDSTILTKITQNLSSAKTSATTMPSTNTSSTYQISTTFTDHNKKNAQDHTGIQSGMIALIAILGSLGLLGLLVLYVCWKRNKTDLGSTRTDEETVKYVGTSVSTDLSSVCPLMNDSPLPGCLARIRRISSSMQETVQAPNEAGPPIIRNGVQREDSSATPFINSVQTHQENERLLVDDVIEIQEVALHYILPAEKLDEFVQTLTMQWVHPCPLSQYAEMELNDIKPVFRELFNSNHENTMKEIFIANPNDINEIVYNLMKAVQRNLGKDFTPQYIIEKLRKKHPQLKYLTDITVDLLEKYRVAETVQC